MMQRWPAPPSMGHGFPMVMGCPPAPPCGLWCLWCLCCSAAALMLHRSYIAAASLLLRRPPPVVLWSVVAVTAAWSPVLDVQRCVLFITYSFSCCFAYFLTSTR